MSNYKGKSGHSQPQNQMCYNKRGAFLRDLAGFTTGPLNFGSSEEPGTNLSLFYFAL